LSPEASEAEIDRAYRRLITQYHPDRLGGIAEDLRKQAEEKAREINHAYDRIKKLRNKH
jgi:curved DNA-binding protein CbpA